MCMYVCIALFITLSRVCVCVFVFVQRHPESKVGQRRKKLKDKKRRRCPQDNTTETEHRETAHQRNRQALWPNRQCSRQHRHRQRQTETNIRFLGKSASCRLTSLALQQQSIHRHFTTPYPPDLGQLWLRRVESLHPHYYIG